MGNGERKSKKGIIFVVVFLVVNILSVVILCQRERKAVRRILLDDTVMTEESFQGVMDNYKQSFRIFVQMMSREIENNPDPDDIWNYLKSIDTPLLEIEGDTFDGLYMYYKGRYLYSWNTPISEYEGYVVAERPWYQAAVKGDGAIVFTPPYMSFANNYILTTISQLQPDKETVFAYDIKMGDIQNLVTGLSHYGNEQIMICDENGTIIGSTKEEHLGGDLLGTVEDAKKSLENARQELNSVSSKDQVEIGKARLKADSAEAFYQFRQDLGNSFQELLSGEGGVVSFKLAGEKYFGSLIQNGGYNFLVLIPGWSLVRETVSIWLIPLLLIELLLIYGLGRVSKGQKNRELKNAYVELGQTQHRLELALSVAQKAAAIDDLTGMMNYKSFRKEMMNALDQMGETDRGILIMIDGDHFKQINDNYGHNVGDEVIKLSAQMIIGRIRTVDLASRLHGDEFAIFVSNTSDYSVARRIMEDINSSIKKEAAKRNMPSITLSAGAVIAKHGDSCSELSKAADAALYKAKETGTHSGGFAY